MRVFCVCKIYVFGVKFLIWFFMIVNNVVSNVLRLLL